MKERANGSRSSQRFPRGPVSTPSLSFVLHCLHLLQALSFPTLVCHSSCLFLLRFSPHLFPLNLSEHIFSKTQTSEDLKAKSLISYTPWLMLNYEPQAKIFFRLIKCSHRFADESNIIIHIYRPGFSDLHQLVCMLVGKTTPALDENHWFNQTL